MNKPQRPAAPRPTRHHLTTLVLLLSLLSAAFSLSGCAQLPDDREPRVTARPADDYATTRAFDAPAADWPADTWWSAYRDPQLDALMSEALAGAPGLAAAAARLRRADAATLSTRADSQPQLRANASVTEQRQSQNHLSPPAATPDGWHDYGRATLDLSWELDFWGRHRAAIAAAISETEAARADAAQARLALTTSIAAAYAELARQHAARDTAESALAVRRQTVVLFRERHAHGLETLGGLRQVEAREAAAEAELPAIDEQIALQQHRLAALAGAGPDRGLALTRPSIDLSRSFGLPPQLAADLLGRRPDVAAARLRAEAGARRIDQAQAGFYPNVNLGAFFGLQSLGLDQLARGGSVIGSVGPAVSLPIFDGGRLRAGLRGADAEYAEAVASYDDAVVQALRDVADAGASRRSLGAQLERTGAAVEASRDAWTVQRRRYAGGLATSLDVLSAEDSLLANLKTQTELQSRAFALDIALVRALGGGYVAPQSAQS